RSGAQQCHLHVVGYGQEGSTQGDFCLSEAYVSADQAIHRFARCHVCDDRFNGRGLIRSFFEAEALGKSLVITQRKLEGVPFTSSAQGVKRQKLCRGVPHLSGCLSPCLVPLSGA